MASEHRPFRAASAVDASRPERRARGVYEPGRESHLLAVFEHASCAIAALAADGTVLAANAALAELLGHPRDALIGMGIGEALQCAGPSLFDEIRARTELAGRTSCLIERDRGDGGSVPRPLVRLQLEAALVPATTDGSRPYCVIQVRGTRERSSGEGGDFDPASRRFHDAFHATPVSMAIRSLSDGEELVNRAMLDLLGYTEEEYRAAPFEEIVHKDDLDELRSEIMSIVVDKTGLLLREVRIIRKDGRILHGQVHFSMVPGADGEPGYVVSQIVDVSESRRAERRLQQRSEFDRVVTALATNFINVALDKVDTHIERALQQIARFVGADRAGVVFFDEASGERVVVRHAWSADAIAWAQDIANLRVWDFAARALLRGDTVYEDDLLEAPPVHDDTRDALLGAGIRSFVAVPFVAERRSGVVGFASSAAQSWDAERLGLLRIGAEMIANVLGRVAVEGALRESEERLRQMADNVQTLFWVCELDPLRVAYASRALGDIFGVSVDDSGMLDIGALDRVVVAEDWPAVSDALARARSERTRVECRIRRAGGEIRWLDTRTFPVVDENGAVRRIAAVTEDVTKRKQAEADREYYVRFERLISRLAAGFIDLPADCIDSGIDAALRAVGEFVEIDIAYFLSLRSDQRTVDEIYAWTSATGQPYRDRLSEISLADYPWTLGRLSAGELMYVPDMREAPKEAHAERQAARAIGLCSAVTCPLLLDGALIGVLGLASLEKPRLWSRDSLALVELVGSMFSSTVARKRAQREITRRSEFERLVGHLAMNLVNQPDAELDAGLEAALGELARFVGFDGAAIFELEAGARTASCSHYWARNAVAPFWRSVSAISVPDLHSSALRLRDSDEVRVAHAHEPPAKAATATALEIALFETLGLASTVQVPMFDSRGPCGVLALAALSERREVDADMQSMLRIAAQLFANTLERRRAERSILEHQAELAHTLRLGTMGELAPWLAHELNQPLAAIMSFARGCQRRLAAGTLDDEALSHAAEEVSRQAARAGEVIQSLRRHVRKHEPRRVWQTMNDLVTSALGLLRLEARELAIDMQTRLDVSPAWVQVDPIQIEQVILNLVRNSFDAIRARSDSSRELQIITQLADGFVEVSVEDSGVGLSEPESSELFDAFRSTKADGLGLGLSLSRSIVESHGGRIRAEPGRGGGAAFRFTIPRQAHPPDAPR